MRSVRVCSTCQEFSFKFQMKWSFRPDDNAKISYLCVCNADSVPSWIDRDYTLVEPPSECPMTEEQRAMTKPFSAQEGEKGKYPAVLLHALNFMELSRKLSPHGHAIAECIKLSTEPDERILKLIEEGPGRGCADLRGSHMR